MTLPNALVDLRKLRDYALSPESDRGSRKARVFASSLGLHAQDAEWLRERILDGVLTVDAVPRGENPYGVLYQVDCPVQTESASAVVRTGWIVLHRETFPRLTSCYVL